MRIYLVNRLLHSYQKSILRGRGDVDSRKYVPMIICSPLIASPCFGPRSPDLDSESDHQRLHESMLGVQMFGGDKQFPLSLSRLCSQLASSLSLSLSCQSLGLIFPYSRGPCTRHQYPATSISQSIDSIPCHSFTTSLNHNCSVIVSILSLDQIAISSHTKKETRNKKKTKT